MPDRPSRPCRHIGCPQLAIDKSGYCAQHLKEHRRQSDNTRPSSTQRGYNRRWYKASRMYLAEHPLCVLCAKKEPPVVRAAALVDHIIPHRGDPELFWDESNWQSLCTECHNRKTAEKDGAFGNVRGRGGKISGAMRT